MAGIGFEIRRILERDNFASIVKAYGYAGLIAAGPWVLSILGVMLIGILALFLKVSQEQINQFQITITYLMMVSLVLTGGLQLVFTRFVSDRLFERQHRIVMPNLLGAMIFCTIMAFVIGAPFALFAFSESMIFRLLLLSNFLVLCNLWMVVIFLSGMKAYRRIIRTLAWGYLIAVIAASLLSVFALEGLLAGVLIGHSALLFALLYAVVREYPGDTLVRFDFLQRKKIYLSLFWMGLVYNVAVWADKLIFWFYPYTSEAVIGPLRASIIYDLPIFMAYLFIIPGMSVFLVRMEADFAEQYDLFYRAVREGDTLQHIEYRKDQMVYTARQGIYEIFKVQGITVVICLLWGRDLLHWIGISPLYIHLFYIDLMAVSVQVLLMAILNVMFYLDARREALFLSVLFLFSNIVFTIITLYWGAASFGYGFALSVTVTAFTGLFVLNRKMDRLEYETFMLQG